MWSWTQYCDLPEHLVFSSDVDRFWTQVLLWEGPACGYRIHCYFLDRTVDHHNRIRWPSYKELGGRSHKPVLQYTEPLYATWEVR